MSLDALGKHFVKESLHVSFQKAYVLAFTCSKSGYKAIILNRFLSALRNFLNFDKVSHIDGYLMFVREIA